MCMPGMRYVCTYVHMYLHLITVAGVYILLLRCLDAQRIKLFLFVFYIYTVCLSI